MAGEGTDDGRAGTTGAGSGAAAVAGAPDDALYRLMTWLSPSFPVGAFSYSHGLEQAVEAGAVGTAATARRWIADSLGQGGGRTDAIFLAHAHRAATRPTELSEVNGLAVAFAPSAERRLETTAQGRAFLTTVAATSPHDTIDAAADALGDGPVAYPVAVGIATAAHEVPLLPAVITYLHAFIANLVSAAVRLVPLGQTDGQRIIAGLAEPVHAIALKAADAPLSAAGGAALGADIASMRHEIQYTRLFRS